MKDETNPSLLYTCLFFCNGLIGQTNSNTNNHVTIVIKMFVPLDGNLATAVVLRGPQEKTAEVTQAQQRPVDAS